MAPVGGSCRDLARTVKGTCDDTGVPLPTRPPGGGSPRLALPGKRACRLDAGAKAHTRSTHAGPRAHRLVGLFQRLIGSPQRLPDRLHGIIGLRGTLARDVGKGVARAAHRVCGVGCACVVHACARWHVTARQQRPAPKAVPRHAAACGRSRPAGPTDRRTGRVGARNRPPQLGGGCAGGQRDRSAPGAARGPLLVRGRLRGGHRVAHSRLRALGRRAPPPRAIPRLRGRPRARRLCAMHVTPAALRASASVCAARARGCGKTEVTGVVRTKVTSLHGPGRGATTAVDARRPGRAPASGGGRAVGVPARVQRPSAGGYDQPDVPAGGSGAVPGRGPAVRVQCLPQPPSVLLRNGRRVPGRRKLPRVVPDRRHL